MRIRCAVDLCTPTLIEGWILNEDLPPERLSVGVVLDGVPIGVAVADRFRQDLRDAAIGDGCCAFSFRMPPDRAGMNAVAFQDRVTLVLHGSDLELPRRCFVPASRSFWFDEPDWMDRLRSLHRSGAIDDRQSDLICRFVRDGAVVLPGSIPTVTRRATLKRLAEAWRNPPPGLLAETFEPAGHHAFVIPTSALRMKRSALCNPHEFLPELAEMVGGAIGSLLAILFGASPRMRSSRHFGRNWPHDEWLPGEFSALEKSDMIRLRVMPGRSVHCLLQRSDAPMWGGGDEQNSSDIDIYFST